MPPRARKPAGIVLLDKPAGPSSFALVADLRRRTGTRTGHAGTLDPFATGLMILLSGAATSLAGCFVGLDKRYVTDIDLTSTTSSGDLDGDVLERHEAPSREELEARLARLRGEIELPIPAVSAVKIGGERAYRLSRRGVVVDMPRRRSQVYALDLIAYSGGSVRLALHVSSGTYVRAIAAALGGHCRTLRRTAVGPFTVDEADGDRLIPASAALARLPESALDRVSDGVAASVVALEQAGVVMLARRRWRRRSVKVARTPGELERGPRAVALGTFDGVHVGHQAVVRAALEAGLAPTVVTFHPHPREVLGNRVELLAPLERRLELLSELGVAETLVVEFTPALAELTPAEFAASYLGGIGAELVVAGEEFRFGRHRGGDLTLLAELGFGTRVVTHVPGVSSTDIRRLLGEGDLAAAATMLGRPAEVEGVVVSGDARGGTLGFPTANLRVEQSLLVPRFGIYAGAALEHRAAVSIGVNPHYGGAERRVEAFLLDFEGDLYGKRLVVSLWQRLRDEAVFESEAELVAQIERDVAAARAAKAPI